MIQIKFKFEDGTFHERDGDCAVKCEGWRLARKYFPHLVPEKLPDAELVKYKSHKHFYDTVGLKTEFDSIGLNSKNAFDILQIYVRYLFFGIETRYKFGFNTGTFENEVVELKKSFKFVHEADFCCFVPREAVLFGDITNFEDLKIQDLNILPYEGMFKFQNFFVKKFKFAGFKLYCFFKRVEKSISLPQVYMQLNPKNRNEIVLYTINQSALEEPVRKLLN